MIEIKIKADNGKVESLYDIDEHTMLKDIAMVVLKLEEMKEILIEESKNYEPVLELEGK